MSNSDNNNEYARQAIHNKIFSHCLMTNCIASIRAAIMEPGSHKF